MISRINPFSLCRRRKAFFSSHLYNLLTQVCTNAWRPLQGQAQSCPHRPKWSSNVRCVRMFPYARTGTNSNHPAALGFGSSPTATPGVKVTTAPVSETIIVFVSLIIGTSLVAGCLSVVIIICRLKCIGTSNK